MKIKISLAFLLVLSAFKAQVSYITLDECQQRAQENYPIIRQYNWIELTEEYTLDNLTKNYLPQVNLYGQATYQSAVTKLPIKGINAPQLDKDQYKVAVEVSQLVWDGGVTRAQSELVKSNTEVEKQKIAVTLYSVQDRVNQLYFGILVLEEQVKQWELLHTTLQSNYTIAQSMLKNGTIMASDVDLLYAEILNNEQKKIELNSLHTAYTAMLSLFVKDQVTENTELEIPKDIGYNHNIRDIDRPELGLYQKQRDLLESKNHALKAKNMPKLFLFGQGGYGRPGLNMLESDFKFYGLAGVKFTWDFSTFYTKKNERKQLDTDSSMIDVQEQTFKFNTEIELAKEQKEIGKYQELMKKDVEIILVRNRVRVAGESKYKNGVYLMNDLIKDIYAENKAQQTQSMHKIDYLLSLYNYKYTQGN